MFAPLVLAILSLSTASPAPRGDEVALAEHGLTLAFDCFEAFETVRGSDSRWKAKLGEHEIQVEFHHLDYRLAEPGDVVTRVIDYLGERKLDFIPDDAFYFEGGAGYAGFTAGAHAALKRRGETVGSQYVLGGLLADGGFALHVRCTPEADEERDAALRRFLEEGLRYEGDVRDSRWTDEEALARWLRDAPEGTHAEFEKKFKRPKYRKKLIVRTEHYIILTNSSSGKKFAQQMEKNYKTIRAMYPFDEFKGRKLMPVFLFQNPDGYYDYYVKIADTTKQAARKSKGHAWRDYYATWYESPVDPVHLHESTHQIFGNRLRLNGGGSWFQEGVAEYIETRPNDRNGAARRVEKGEHVPLEEFVELRSLLYSDKGDGKGGNDAGDLYKQAALLIEFLRESKLGKGKFEEFTHRIGRLPRGRRALIEAVVQDLYGLDLAGLDAAWQNYCEKR